MFSHRATQTELMDDLNLSGEDLRRNLDELEIINKWLGGNRVVTAALNRLFPSDEPHTQPVTLADLGCGGGDTLREVADWARRQHLPAQLTGIDANAFMIHYAQGKCQGYPNIRFIRENIFGESFKQKEFDVIICSLFCHHFTDDELARLLRQLHGQAKRAVIINDLHRHPLAYYAIKWLTKLFSRSYLVKNDAPLSVLRAFRRAELSAILHRAGLSHYQLSWRWAFRWQIIIPK